MINTTETNVSLVEPIKGRDEIGLQVEPGSGRVLFRPLFAESPSATWRDLFEETRRAALADRTLPVALSNDLKFDDQSGFAVPRRGVPGSNRITRLFFAAPSKDQAESVWTTVQSLLKRTNELADAKNQVAIKRGHDAQVQQQQAARETEELRQKLFGNSR